MGGLGIKPANQNAPPSSTARWIAVSVCVVAVGVLCGWAFAIPALRSILPGAVEMKVNTAIALLLAAIALFLRARLPRATQGASGTITETSFPGHLATAAALAVIVIGLVTLSEYLSGWNARIDDFIFRDTVRAFARSPGRMSPFSAVAFINTGAALALSGRRRMRWIAFVGVLLTTAIGLISLLGYFWNAHELTTDQWIPPVAVHTAVAFILLGIGTALVARGDWHLEARKRKEGRGYVEAKVLIGFVLALILLGVGGDITYRTQSNQSLSGQRLVEAEQARTALGATYAAVLDAESAQHNYLWTGSRIYRDRFLAGSRRVEQQLSQLATAGSEDDTGQQAILRRLKTLTAARMSELTRQLAQFETKGDDIRRPAIATDDGATTMLQIRDTVAALDAREEALSRSYTLQLTRARSYTLIAMLGTLMTATATLLFLFGSIVRDISERAEITDALGRAQREAQKATEAKSQFLAAMSHEIRTPMNGVVGMVELLEQSSLLGPQMQMVQLIRESAHSLLTIINDILDFSKIEAGRFEIERRPIVFAEIIEGSCGLLNRLAERQKTVLTVFCDPNIPDPLIGDDTRLRQVIINLTNNAIKFSSGLAHSGRVSVRATLVERNHDRAIVEVRVTDNGIGMDQATRARLFTSFMQADVSTTRRYGGTGLGLVISKQLVDLMGGTIAVETAVGAGSTFTLRLPLDLAPGATADLPRGSALTGIACLIVGAQYGLADDLATYLGSEGAAVSRLASISSAGDWKSSHASGLAVWVVEVWDDLPTLEELLCRLQVQSRADVRVVLIVMGRGQRTARAEAAGFVMVDGNALSRNALVRAVGAAAGRMTAEPAPGAARSRSARPVLATREEACRERRLILVAEDNEINQRLITEQLTLLGYTADVVANGREALRQWHTGDYALLLVDLHMPEMDGYDLTLAIRLAEANTRVARTLIIALTANALPGEAERCRAVGMDDYLTKPASLATLATAAEKWLGAAPGAQKAGIERPAMDVSALEALIGSDPRVVISFLEHFDVSAAQSALELKSACDTRQPRQAAAVAHKLKSAARSVGAERLATLCAQIEAAGNDNATERVLLLLPDFEAELSAVQQCLRNIRSAEDRSARCA